MFEDLGQKSEGTLPAQTPPHSSARPESIPPNFSEIVGPGPSQGLLFESETEPSLPPQEPKLSPETHPEEPTGEQETDSRELSDWKEALRTQFEEWLAGIEEVPETETDAQPEELSEPDLCSFYEQLAASNSESRKANRRTVEALSQWGQILSQFEVDLRQLREHASRLGVASEKQGLPRSACVGLIEILDRMRRLAAAFDAPPPKPRWKFINNDSVWRQAWDTQGQGFDILVGHFEAYLQKEGVSRMEVLGKPFDPTVMVAVAIESNSKYPPQTVTEEVTCGYLHRGELLRAAQVKVTPKT